MPQREEVTFEVLILVGSRWETQGVYKSKEQHRAVADAKSLEKVSTIKQVKVVKEFYDAKAGGSRSLNIYESVSKEPPQQRQGAKPRPNQRNGKSHGHGAAKGAGRGRAKAHAKSKAGGGSPSDSMVGTPAPEEGGAKRPSILMTFVQIILSLVFAAAAAVTVTMLANTAMRGMHTIGFLTKDEFLIWVFILVFVITALALVTRILNRLKNIGPLPIPLLGDDVASGAAGASRRGATSLEQYEAYQLKRETDARKKAEVEARLRAEKEARDAAEKKAQEEAEAKEKAEQSEDAGAEDEKQEEQPEQYEEDLLSEIVTMNAFTAQALDVIKGGDVKQDAHTVFGLVLFLVGAVQSLRHHEEMSDETFRQVVAQTLGGLGLSKERTEHFIEHTDEYLISNPRYSQMFQTGRQAMASYMEKGTGPRVALSGALSDWAAPKGAAGESSKPVTVLFTDIAGSTAMTQKLGDAGAQEVVRVHNAIVREALQAFAGKEVKHTGDGIMASFPQAAAGVEAAIEMQTRTKAHNEAHPDAPLGLKIGLNAGEPISEDDDLFGTTVQLAARIVDKAGAGQILVSGSVHGLSQGKGLKFERFADVEMKGFDEAVTVYAAQWDPDAPPIQPEPQVELQPEAQVVPEAAPEVAAEAASGPGVQESAKASPDTKPDDASAS